MKSFALAISGLALATSVAADLPTYTSTLLSSTCFSGYSNITLSSTVVEDSTAAVAPASLTAASSESDQVVYETDIVSNQKTVTTVRTTCSDDLCYATTDVNVLTTVTATVDGILTTYVTAVPITSIYNDASATADATATATADASAKAAVSAKAPVSASAAASAAPAASASDADDADSEVTEVATATNIHSTVVTVTSCSDHKCSATVVTTGVTTVTATVDGVETVYTTYCPLTGAETTETKAAETTGAETTETKAKASTASTTAPATSEKAKSAATVTNAQTTVVTVTSCADNKCAETPVTTGVTALTTTINGVESVYTTFCPLSGEVEASSAPAPVVSSAPAPAPEVSSAPAPAPEVSSAPAPAPAVSASTQVITITSCADNKCEESTVTTLSAAPESTVDVITNNIITQSYAPQPSSSALISTYEGAAARFAPVALGAVPALLMLL
ncbi:Flocculin type 3 repeat family protein [Clavispora lusitaniae]|uniref:Flocculin type 3 repeat family protein n=1 Tax=Clavispora lusitaniae TaxID=36911 RepID=UPI00202BC510|nr:Flocculin type 3 repeat family protein [Clavispora lusitaniae]